MAVYGIPSTQTLIVERVYANVLKAIGAAADMSLNYNPIPGTVRTGFIAKHIFGVDNAGDQNTSIAYGVPRIFVGPGILKLTAISDTNNAVVSAGFDGFLRDN